MSNEHGFSSSELARLAGASRKLTRLCIDRGLIERPGPQGHGDAAVERLRLIVLLRRAGFTLSRVERLFRQADQGASAAPIADAVGEAVRDVSEVLEQLTRFRQHMPEPAPSPP